MRRKDKEIKNKERINEILSNSLICRLAFTDKEYPYIVPLNFGYQSNVLYFHCALEGKKIDLINQNNKVSFEITNSYDIVKNDISCKWTTKFSSIIGYGKIEIIKDFKEKVKGLDIIMQQHGKKENSYSEKVVDKVNILKLKIESLTAKQSL